MNTEAKSDSREAIVTDCGNWGSVTVYENAPEPYAKIRVRYPRPSSAFNLANILLTALAIAGLLGIAFSIYRVASYTPEPGYNQISLVNQSFAILMGSVIAIMTAVKFLAERSEMYSKRTTVFAQEFRVLASRSDDFSKTLRKLLAALREDDSQDNHAAIFMHAEAELNRVGSTAGAI